MKISFHILALGILAVTLPAHAGAGSSLLEEQYKAALNRMTQQVRQAPDADSKRAILDRFTEKMSDGLQNAEGTGSLTPSDRVTLGNLASRFLAYRAELRGTDGNAR